LLVLEVKGRCVGRRSRLVLALPVPELHCWCSRHKGRYVGSRRSHDDGDEDLFTRKMTFEVRRTQVHSSACCAVKCMTAIDCRRLRGWAPGGNQAVSCRTLRVKPSRAEPSRVEPSMSCRVVSARCMSQRALYLPMLHLAGMHESMK